MKKVLISFGLILSCLCLTACKDSNNNRQPTIDYTQYHQMNETVIIANLEIKVVDCYVNPLEVAPSSTTKIITVRIDYQSKDDNITPELTSNKVVLVEPLNHNNKISNYTVDGLDYLKDPNANPFIRFEVKKTENEFVMQITVDEEQALFYLLTNELS